MILERPSVKYKDSYLEAIRQFQLEGAYTELKTEALESTFEAYVNSFHKEERGEDLEDWQVPQTTFWAIVENEFVGRISVRHYLTDGLRKFGGHIGYEVSPAHRKKGYAGQMLQKVLPYVKAIGIQKAMLTCNVENQASQKIIERAGGIFEKTLELVPGEHTVRHYWIEL